MPAEQGAGSIGGSSGANGSAVPDGSPGAGEYSSGRLEAEQVRAMFDRISGVYDVLNTAMTAGLHRRWRERAADLARVGPGSRVLDVATGTGDLAVELCRRVTPAGEVIGSDFSEAMLDRARAKAERMEERLVRPRFEWADALALPYATGSFDAATVGFGARNFSDLGRGLTEMARVVRPGGIVVVLEMTTPRKFPLATFFRVWFDIVIPTLGRLAAAAARTLSRVTGASIREDVGEAYTYLPSSVRRFPAPRQLAAAMHSAGLRDIKYLITAGGIIAIHAGTVPPEATR